MMERVFSNVTVGTPTSFGGRAGAAMVRVWLSLWSERHALERLDARMLRDIGLTDEDARQEASRSVFDVPPSRLPPGF